MMSSWHAANVWDWLSMSLMIVGFTILLGLTAYLMLALIVGDGGGAPSDTLDRIPPRETATDEGLVGRITPLAS